MSSLAFFKTGSFKLLAESERVEYWTRTRIRLAQKNGKKQLWVCPAGRLRRRRLSNMWHICTPREIWNHMLVLHGSVCFNYVLCTVAGSSGLIQAYGCPATSWLHSLASMTPDNSSSTSRDNNWTKILTRQKLVLRGTMCHLARDVEHAVFTQVTSAASAPRPSTRVWAFSSQCKELAAAQCQCQSAAAASCRLSRPRRRSLLSFFVGSCAVTPAVSHGLALPIKVIPAKVKSFPD